jgi:hypothetical protein
MTGPRYEKRHDHTVCLDCGAIVAEHTAHTRFHSILSGHAWMLAILKTSHVAAGVHDRYDVDERAARRQFDSWTNDALAEVISEHAQEGTGSVAGDGDEEGGPGADG